MHLSHSLRTRLRATRMMGSAGQDRRSHSKLPFLCPRTRRTSTRRPRVRCTPHIATVLDVRRPPPCNITNSRAKRRLVVARVDISLPVAVACSIRVILQ